MSLFLKGKGDFKMLYIIGVLTVILDFITKRIAVMKLKPVRSIPIIDRVFNLTYVENRGAAFGILQNKQWLFIVLSVIILIFLVFIYRNIKRRTLWLKIGVALIFGGAIGNFIDRLFIGYVVDFLDFCLINFPVFNVADIAVCVGAGLILIHYLFYGDKES